MKMENDKFMQWRVIQKIFMYYLPSFIQEKKNN